MKYFLGIGFFLLSLGSHAQSLRHSEKFEQLAYELRDPNVYRNAAGAPGHAYWQNRADYDIQIELDDERQRIRGSETITYHNESPDPLPYLWLQLDQNVRATSSHTFKSAPSEVREFMGARDVEKILDPTFDGGFKISAVSDEAGQPLPYVINQTMMVVDLPRPLKTGESFSFQVDWAYNINDIVADRGRSGYEFFPDDGNYLYTLAQFFPRMCVYSDYGGWQNKQFLGDGEFTLPFGQYRVAITVPADHVLGATGRLLNPEEVLTPTQQERLDLALQSDTPVMIVTETEARLAEQGRSQETKTWRFEADSVRDFAFVTSRKFIWDAMGVGLEGRDDKVMAMSYYPKEGNPLWEEYSTRVVAHTLKTYSHFTFPYPYHKAISVHAVNVGMEYPMICFNFGRPNSEGHYSRAIKHAMIGVIIHEVGHNFFPMIVNSDERQWTWMDEGLNSFLEALTAEAWDPEDPPSSANPEDIVPYMSLDKSLLSPIMTNPEQVIYLGPNAYTKPATALNILRETVMGRELFDRAFKEYSRRWAFKHPTPADFFRTMEDASAVDLDWFWRGWFYSTDHVDIAMEVTPYRLTTDAKEVLPAPQKAIITDKGGKKKKKRKEKQEEEATEAREPAPAEIMYQPFYARLSEEQQARLTPDSYVYELRFENKGGLVMPIILGFTYADESTEIVRLPAEVWRKNDQVFTKVFVREREVVGIALDPFKETADTQTSNHTWPQQASPSRFERFKRQKAGTDGP